MAEVRPEEDILLTHFIVSDDVERSRRFYTEVLGGKMAFGGPTPDPSMSNYPTAGSSSMPVEARLTTSLRSRWRRRTIPTESAVSSISGSKTFEAVYTEWSARGAQFLTPPKQHKYEIRCYIRDPDGHLIEVGQTTDPEGDWSPAQWGSTAHTGESE